jgi:hypothetical protein
MNHNIATSLAVIAIIFVLITYITSAPLVTLAISQASRWRSPEKGQRREGNERHAVLSDKKGNASPVEALVLHSSKRPTSGTSPVRARR